jgi:hypothetical protein
MLSTRDDGWVHLTVIDSAAGMCSVILESLKLCLRSFLVTEKRDAPFLRYLLLRVSVTTSSSPKGFGPLPKGTTAVDTDSTRNIPVVFTSTVDKPSIIRFPDDSLRSELRGEQDAEHSIPSAAQKFKVVSGTFKNKIKIRSKSSLDMLTDKVLLWKV